MTETLRTLDTLLTNMPVGVADGTSAQDIRDMLWSVLGVVPYVAKTANYTAAEYDHYIDVDATSGAVTITLPAVRGTTRVGKTYIIRKVDTSVNAVIIDGASSELIEADTTQVLFTFDSYAEIVNKSTLWRIAASRGIMSGRIFAQTASAAAVASSTSETTILSTGIGTKTLPANFFRIGRAIRVTVHGIMGNTGTPNLTIKAKFGSTVITTTGTIVSTSVAANSGFKLEAIIVCRTVGASGTVMAHGDFFYNLHRLQMPNTTTIVVDTTASQAVDVTAQFGTSDPLNTITGMECIVEIIS